MTSEKRSKLDSELPIAFAPSATSSVNRCPSRWRTATRCALVSFALVWSLFHFRYTFFNRVLLGEYSQGIYAAGNGGFLTGKKAEELYLSVPNAASAIAASRLFATKPHMAGTPGDFKTAMEFLKILQTNLEIESPLNTPIYSAGSVESRNATLSIPLLDTPTAWVDTYYPVLNTPLDRALEVLDENGNTVWQANLEETPDDADPEAAKYFDAVPAFHGLSKGGEVQGQLVYANYGRKEDYDALVASGVDFTGKVVLVRYGSNFRGLKIKGAQELGAVGVLIYSDLRDDGTVTEENGYVAYPHGSARNPNSVQRGSVQFISVYPGDPTTPGYPSYENSTRTEGENIPSIPSLPISWANSRALLGEIVKAGGNRTVKLVNNVDTKVTPIWNTMGVIPGHIKNEVVVVGNHRDGRPSAYALMQFLLTEVQPGYVMGAADPSSGTVAIHEVIRGFGLLLKHGWKPLRTIVIASWDAEEYGLIGSTEWGEDFEDFIKDYVVAYVNTDVAASGSRFRGEASPSLAHLLRETAKEIPHPSDFGRTLWDARMDRGQLFGKNMSDEMVKMFAEEDMEHMNAGNGFGVGTLGSGSDYTVFLQRIGIASLQVGFGSTLSDSVYHYHSVYDSERWQELYGDPGFGKHIAIAKHLGLQTLRLVDSIILPVNTTHYAYELEAYLHKVEEVALSSSVDFEVDFSSLKQSIANLQAASADLDEEKEKAEHELKCLLKKWQKKRSIHHKLKKALCKLKKALGKNCHDHKKAPAIHDHEKTLRRLEKGLGKKCHDHMEAPTIHDHEETLRRLEKAWGKKCHDHMKEHKGNELLRLARGGKCVELRPRVGCLPGWMKEQADRRENEGHGNSDHPRHFPSRKFVRAVKRVQAVNKKLSTFERGFISEGGIKDREWFRHLGVAPGKWLGYGATTFPGLTEAIKFERNETLVKYEANRLKGAIDGIIKKLY